jgi:hypothetical protein
MVKNKPILEGLQRRARRLRNTDIELYKYIWHCGFIKAVEACRDTYLVKVETIKVDNHREESHG